MTDVSRLSVSLTKHGAHKIALLLKKYDRNDLLSKLVGELEGVNIDRPQAKKNLSVGTDGVVPVVWDDIKKLGDEYVDAAVFLAILYSHNKLITAMSVGRKGLHKGVVKRGEVLDGKEFTNFAHIVEELGLSSAHSVDHVSYDLTKLFALPGLGAVAKRVLELKLKTAGWTRKNSVVEECVALRWHDALAIDAEFFSTWLSSKEPAKHIEDEDFFSDDISSRGSGKFQFSPGHNAKKTGSVLVSGGASKVATLLHNEIQNRLYAQLCRKHGRENVGTEIPTGYGTSIDVGVRRATRCTFYEIKTAGTIKACIRQAIPQLLEYAYWGGSTELVDRLVIVSQHPSTPAASAFLELLREKFHLPLEYEQFQL